MYMFKFYPLTHQAIQPTCRNKAVTMAIHFEWIVFVMCQKQTYFIYIILYRQYSFSCLQMYVHILIWKTSELMTGIGSIQHHQDLCFRMEMKKEIIKESQANLFNYLNLNSWNG